MSTQIVYETHSTTEDNESGHATGWLPGRLSAEGVRNAEDLGRRRREDGIDAVFTSDLGRAVQTVTIAFGDRLPILHDWRLRECDYGQLNGHPRAEVHTDPLAHLDVPFPGGESWRQATARVGRFLADVPTRWDGARILVVGHVATRHGLAHHLTGATLEDLLVADFAWQEGWEYVLDR